MKYSLSAPGLMFFWPAPVLGGDICQGDFFCYLFFGVIAYLPYFLVLTALTWIVFILLRPKSPFGKNLIYSILLSLVLIFFYHYFLSIWVEKQEVVNSYQQALDQQGYRLYEPTYIPDQHELFESRVDHGHLSFYYQGQKPGQFVISEFKKPPRIDLSPPDCLIEGDDFEVIDPDVSGFSSAVSGNCQEIKTPKGISVYLMTFKISSEKKLAAVVLGDTLITINGYNFSNQELMDLIDGFKEKKAAEINFKVIDRTIGR